MTNASRAVLVIEDDNEIRSVLRPALELEGFRVIEAATGARGLIEWQTHRPDLAIVDLGLPDMDGVEVIRRARSWSRIPLVVLSARTQEEQIVAALEAGADDYITKPFGDAGTGCATAGGACATASGRRKAGRRSCVSDVVAS